MNLDDFSIAVDEETRAINPQVALDEQNAFINNLRDVQSAQNAEIMQQTHDLGTDIPSQLGGLTGGEGYFASRYQTPFTNTAVGDLRAAAQAQALSEAFDLELARANARYKSAYDAYRRRAASRGGGGGGAAGDGDNQTKGDVDYKSNGGTEYVEDAFSQNKSKKEFGKILEEQARRNAQRKNQAAIAAGLLAFPSAMLGGIGGTALIAGANEIRKRIQGK